jgi:hypothetical protein
MKKLLVYGFWAYILFAVVSLPGCHSCDKPKSACPNPGPIPGTSSNLISPQALPPGAKIVAPPQQSSRLPIGPGGSDAPGVKLAVPNNTDGEGVRQTTQLYPQQPNGSAQPPEKSKSSVNSKEPPALPTGIPQFALAKENPKVASGLKPFAEGWDWLKANGYRGVLHLKVPGVNDSSDRDTVETKLGLKFTSLQVSPEDVSTELIEKFTQNITDPSNLPLYVYDEDGTLAGGMWYLYYLQVAKMPEAKARQEAARLGLKDNAAGDQGTMWVAIQKYLESLKK